MGVSQSLIQELKGEGPQATEVRRRILLGLPLEAALRPISNGSSPEASMLASLVISSKNGSALQTARKGGRLSDVAERWVKARENQRMEAKVRRVRGLIASGVSGAVTSMIASIGPLLGSLSSLGSPGTAPSGSLLLPAAAMALISSGMLGVYTSGKGFFLNVILAGVVYLMVALAVAPLASLPSVTWAIK